MARKVPRESTIMVLIRWNTHLGDQLIGSETPSQPQVELPWARPWPVSPALRSRCRDRNGVDPALARAEPGGMRTELRREWQRWRWVGPERSPWWARSRGTAVARCTRRWRVEIPSRPGNFKTVTQPSRCNAVLLSSQGPRNSYCQMPLFRDLYSYLPHIPRRFLVPSQQLRTCNFIYWSSITSPEFCSPQYTANPQSLNN